MTNRPASAPSKLVLYLAGSSREHKRVSRWAGILDQSGLVHIAHRWFETAAGWSGKDHLYTRDQAAAEAHGCFSSVLSAQVFWLLYPSQPTVGAFVELGAALGVTLERRSLLGGALGKGPSVVVSGPGSSSTVFTAPADYRDESDECAYHEVMQMALAHRVREQKRKDAQTNQRRATPLCRYCSNPVSKPGDRYCSVECADKSTPI